MPTSIATVCKAILTALVLTLTCPAVALAGWPPHGVGQTVATYIQNDGLDYGTWSTPLDVPAATDSPVASITASLSGGDLIPTNCGGHSAFAIGEVVSASGVTAGTSLAVSGACVNGTHYKTTTPGVPVSAQTVASRSMDVYAAGHAEPPVIAWAPGAPFQEVSGITYACVNGGSFTSVDHLVAYLNGPGHPYTISATDSAHCPDTLTEWAIPIDTALLTAGRNELRVCAYQAIGPGACLQSSVLPLTDTSAFAKPKGSLVLVAGATLIPKYVDLDSGSDSNDCSVGAKCQHICAAINKAGTNGDVSFWDIRLEATASSGYAVSGCTSHPTALGNLTIEPDTGVDPALAQIVSQDTNGFFTQHVHSKVIYNFPITVAVHNGLQSKFATNAMIWFDGGSYTGPGPFINPSMPYAGAGFSGGVYMTGGFAVTGVWKVCVGCSALANVTMSFIGSDTLDNPGAVYKTVSSNLIDQYPATGTLCASDRNHITDISSELYMIPGSTITVAGSLVVTTIASVDSPTQITVNASNTVSSGCVTLQPLKTGFHPDTLQMDAAGASGAVIDTYINVDGINGQCPFVKVVGGAVISNVVIKNSAWNNSANVNRSCLAIADASTFVENFLIQHTSFGDAITPSGHNLWASGLSINSQLINSSGNPALNQTGQITGLNIANSPTLHADQ